MKSSTTQQTMPPPRPDQIVPRGVRAIAAPALAALIVGACSNPLSPPRSSTPENQGQEIIGGFNANDQRLDGTGSLVITYPPGYFPPGFPTPAPEEFCTAALLTPESVITAKHCALIIPIAAQYGVTVSYAVGSDSAHPREMVEVVATETEPGDQGGVIGVGRDVAVVHLEHPLTDAPMVTVGALSDEDIGHAFAAIGYGVQDNTGKAGTRKLGKQTLRAREGKVFEILFGTFERFFTWLQSGVVTPEELGLALPGAAPDAAPPPPGDGGAGSGGRGGSVDGGSDGGFPMTLEEFAHLLYDTTLLEKDYEVVTGGAPGDAQPCFGDSGGPLVSRIGGQFVSFGVVSGGIGSVDLVCDVGSIYASFGPEALAFIERAKAWVDPCGDLTSAGTCAGDIARRCTTTAEGRRRLVEFDCASLGLACNSSPAQVTCGDTSIGSPPPPPPPGKMATLPNFRLIADRIFKAALLKKQ